MNRNEYDEHSQEWDKNRASGNIGSDALYGQQYTQEQTNYDDHFETDGDTLQQEATEETQDHIAETASKSRYFNDKSHLVWEQERIQRKRDDYYKRNDPMTMHKYFRDPEPGFSVATTRGKLMAYDFTKPAKRGQAYVNHQKSAVPVLADHYSKSKTHTSAAPDKQTKFEKVYNSYMTQQKRNDGLGSIFHQSEYQQRLQNNRNVSTDKPPMSHSSFSKSFFDFNTAR